MKRITRILMMAALVSAVAGLAAAQTVADKYEKEARDHSAMPGFYVGNPNHPMNASMALHCKQLAELARAKAERARATGVLEDEALPPAPKVIGTGKSPSPSH